ncbi:haloacid dehalogenase type II [Rhodococcus sp. NPDC059234]|uniref:haloacid dehalogenase type II n=1 Tax=Rhodococcus sp. NPDC059234 TaxID=3346781 RepID=UPI00366E354B
MTDPGGSVRALLFDVQGTATDFRSTVVEAAEHIVGGRWPGIDWGGFVDRWRAAYFAALTAMTGPDGAAGAAGAAGAEWSSVHAVYRDSLRRLLDEHGVRLDDTEVEELTLSWQRLRPWPDTVAGLERLRSRYTLATLSNADVSAVVNIAKAGGLRWDAVFAAEMFGAFKPSPAAYLGAARYLGLPPERIMMVACHKYDVVAAAGLGFRTAFVARPLEFGVAGAVDVTYDRAFDVNAADFLDLADQLGC